MADFSWAYIDCDNVQVTSYSVPTGSLLYSHGHKVITGSQRFMIDTGSGDASTWEVRLTGNLDISGTIRSYKFETITYESTNYQGSNTFGNSSADTHKFTGELSSSGPLNVVGATTLESTLHVSGAVSGAVGITGSSLTINDTIELNANGKITKVHSISGSNDVSFLNLYANNGGTNSARLLGTGEISGSGPLNIVGAATLESTLHVSGAISTALGVSSSTGISASYAHLNNLAVNDGGTKSIRLNGDGTLVIAGSAADTTCVSASGDINVVGKGFFEDAVNISGAVNIGGNAAPTANGTLHLGSTSKRWGTLFATKLSASADANIAGNAFVEGTLNVTGAVTTAAGVTASAGLTSSYGFLNRLQINGGGTNNIKLKGTGEISGSGPLNVVGAATLESTLNVTGAITTAAGLTASAGASASYGFLNRLQINGGGTNNIKLKGTGEISGSGVLNIVGAATLESTLNVTGAITTAAGVTASVGVSSSYGFLNRLQINGGGTRQIKLKGNGILTIEGSAADRTCLSASGDINVVGKGFFENTLHVTGAISGAVGITGSSLTINDTIELNANGNISNVHHIYPAADNTYDLGAEASRWRNIYTGDLHLKNDRGDWTVIEESDYLSLTNNKTGHRYKILMERID